MKLNFEKDLFDLEGNVITKIEQLKSKEFCDKTQNWINQYKNKIHVLDESYFKVENYEGMLSLTLEKKNILKKCVIQIISEIEEVKKIPLLIWLNGSYARNSCVYGSDIDINFCYPNGYYDWMIAIEEYVSIVLCEIFGLEFRDLVHPMGYSRLENEYDIGENLKRKLHLSENVYLPYVIRKSGLGIMKEFFELSREVEDIDKHFILGLENDPAQEWLYTKEVIYKNNYEFHKLKIYTDEIPCDRNLIMNNIRLKLFEIDDLISKNKDFKVATVKNIYRNKPLNLFYQYTIWATFPSKGEVLCDISKLRASEYLKDCYVRYRKKMMNFEKYMYVNGFEWSTHNYINYIDIAKAEFVEVRKETINFIHSLIMEIEKYGK